MKKALKDQIEEKKKYDYDFKKNDEKYFEIIKNNLQKFSSDKENEIKNNQDKVSFYRDQLEKQIGEKVKKKVFMDENEKQFNRDLMGRIISDYE